MDVRSLKALLTWCTSPMRGDSASTSPGSRRRRAPLGCGRPRIEGVRLRVFGPAEHADQAPDPMIVYRCDLARPPDEADHREALP